VDATPVESIKDVRELISAGKTDAAIAGLRKLRKQTPQNGYYVLMLANLYFDKGWWGDALEHYRAAVRISPAYRSRGDINKNLIAMLSGKRIYRKASQVIQNNLGRHALPHLRRAAKRDKSPIVRRRAAQLVKKISH
jgi:predicted Zn-dependent protease